MKRKTGNSRKLGMFITLGVILFIVSIYFIGTKQNLFRQSVKVSAVFSDVKGLRIGGNVRFTGITVGTVSDMTILSDSAVQVELAIDRNVIRFIKENSVATIASEGLLGSKIVVLLPGSPDEEPIEEGETLPTLEPVEIDDILREIKTSSERISSVSRNLIDITEKINRGEGIFGKIFTDTTMTYNLTRTSRNLREISEKVKQGEGLIGKLFADTSFANNLDTTGQFLSDISSNLVEITNKIERGEGIFGRLFTDTTLTQNIYVSSKNLNESTKNLSSVTANLIAVTDKMNRGEGVFSKMLVDSAFADSLDITLQELNKTLIELREASEAIQRSGLIRAFSKKEKKEEE